MCVCLKNTVPVFSRIMPEKREQYVITDADFDYVESRLLVLSLG
jgi:hypothetical protein